MEQYIRIAVVAVCAWAAQPPQLMAQNPDIEAMKRSLEAQIGVYQRLNSLEQRVSSLEASQPKGGDTHLSGGTSGVPGTDAQPSPGAGVAPPAEAAPAPSVNTAICQCRGSNRGVCYCLQNRVACKCHATKGSEWVLNEQGRATHKTGQYANPNTRPTATPAAKPAAPVAPETGYAVSVRGNIAYWTDSSGRSWNNGGTGLSDGAVYGGRFTYRGGRMFEPGASQNAGQMAAVIQPKGHFEIRRVCRGAYCENVRVWVSE